VIVVDTNVLVHYWLETTEYAAASALLDDDPHWCAPYLWRSEFQNALAVQIRHANLSLDRARVASRRAHEQMDGHEYFIDPMAVLELATTSTCSPSDCEFVALAQELGVPLVTADRQILRNFPGIARPLADYR
jgi:predicted nucleic acid-binding protein